MLLRAADAVVVQLEDSQRAAAVGSTYPHYKDAVVLWLASRLSSRQQTQRLVLPIAVRMLGSWVTDMLGVHSFVK